jgi:hypothetical protein
MMSLWNAQQYLEKQDSSKNLAVQRFDSGGSSSDVTKALTLNQGETSVNNIQREVVPFAVRLHRRLTSNSFKTDPDVLDSMPLF